MIKLYYVRGINRYDTPYFPNITAQEDYFEGKVFSSLDAWYPPHYDNTIRLTSDDISFKGNLKLDLPIDTVIEEGSSNKEITNFDDVIFKRT